MDKRVGYIDAIKGLAILLMVMGHVIAYQFPSYQVALNDSPQITMIVWRIIYSFHMPLLMFCSGLFIIKQEHTDSKQLVASIWKRVQSLVLPSIFAGGILWLQRGNFGYWFLWTLFQFVVVTLLLDFLCSFIPKYGRKVFIIFLCLISGLIILFLKHFYYLERLPIIDVVHWNLYPYFCLGIICKQYNLIEKVFLKNWVYTIALVVFGVMTYWITIEGNHIPKLSITGMLLPISVIIALIYLFKEGLSGESKIEKWLQYLGTHSLEVYILHLFFLFRMYPVGEFVLTQANSDGGGRTIFFVQLITSLIASVIIIYLCYFVMNIISKSSLLSLLLLGRRVDAK